MKKILVSSIILTIMLTITGIVIAGNKGHSKNICKHDYVNIGDIASEKCHHLTGWGDIVEPTSGWGGFDGNLRVVWEPDGGQDASLIMNRKDKDTIIIHHLDGYANDGFDLFINEEKIGSYIDEYNTEEWVITSFSLSQRLKGSPRLEVKIVATGDAWSGQSIYGQLAIDYIELQ